MPGLGDHYPRLRAALRRQKRMITWLLREAEIPPAEAEELLIEMIRTLPEHRWETTEAIDELLLAKVAAACAASARRRGITSLGLKVAGAASKRLLNTLTYKGKADEDLVFRDTRRRRSF